MPKKIKEPRKNQLESTYFEEVEVTDPVTGKKFKQQVKVYRLKPISTANIDISSEEEDDLADIKPNKKPVLIDVDA